MDLTRLAIPLFFFAFVSAVPLLHEEYDEAHMTVPELITEYGYPVEEHFVTTEDGYILALHRIPHGKTAHKKNKVVFLMHGLLCSSTDWIITGPTHGLGYIMADEGYDVWMGNGRGNHLSRNHSTLNPDSDSEFWQFSWHEIGTIDVAAMIDYVLEQTNQSQLFHIGHSQGTTSFYVLTSMRPEYNDKVAAHFSLAPVGYMSHMTSPLFRFLAFWSGPLDVLMNLIGWNEFLPTNDFMSMIGSSLCGDTAITQILCKNVLFVVAGYNPKELNATILPVLTGHTPAGCSVNQLMHYAQEINSGAFRQFDFGLGNLRRYGSFTPPRYPLEKITTPIYLFYSHNDWLAAERDVMHLCQDLRGSCKGHFLVSDDAFNHLDYLYAIRAPQIAYNKIISLMARM